MRFESLKLGLKIVVIKNGCTATITDILQFSKLVEITHKNGFTTYVKADEFRRA